MADFPAGVIAQTGTPAAHPTRVAAQHARVRKTNTFNTTGWDITSVDPTSAPPQTYLDATPTPPPLADFAGCVEERFTFGFDWFEKFHVTPGGFFLGNVLTTQQIPVAVYSAFRTETHTWDAFVNNAGAGVDLLNIPVLPFAFAPQSGLTTLILEVSPAGPPSVNTTLDFVFDTETISPPITLERLVLWSVRPDLPYTELLEFLTQIMTKKDGTEQRISKRISPRQIFEWSMLLDPGPERARIHNLLFNWQSRVFGVPVWTQSTFPTAAISVNDTVINVRSTAYADYRESPGLALIFDPETGTNDVAEIAVGGITATTLTLVNGVQNAYSTRALVCPLRTGRARPSIGGSRFRTDAARLRVSFEVLDNVVDLASTAGFPTTLNSKVVVDDPNVVRGSMREQFQRDIVVLDNGSGIPFFDSPWEKGKRASTKTFWANNQQKAWEIRQLMYALRGRQISWYLPTFGKDLTPFSQLISGSTTLTIVNVGYDRYVNQQRPYHLIRVHFKDPVANPPLIREITGSSEVDAASENLTVDATWPATYQPEDVERIEYLELVRADSDSIRFAYDAGEKTTRVTVPVISVFD